MAAVKHCEQLDPHSHCRVDLAGVCSPELSLPNSCSDYDLVPLMMGDWRQKSYEGSRLMYLRQCSGHVRFHWVGSSLRATRYSLGGS